jgi:hypothetical protein
MAALTKGRETSRMGDQVLPNLVGVPLKAGAKIFIGGLVCVDSSGFAVAGSTATDQVPLGVAARVQPDAVKGGIPGVAVDNTSGSNGDLTVNVLCGVFKFENGDTIAQANVGQACYIVDDQTVAKSSATNSRSVAGTIVQVDSATDATSNSGAGVWVAVGKESPAAATFVDGLHSPAGANLGDADATIQIAAGTWRKLPTLTAPRILTLGNTGAKAGDQMFITRLDASANAYTIKDNAATTLLVMPASKVNSGLFQHDGTNWFLKLCGTQ